MCRNSVFAYPDYHCPRRFYRAADMAYLDPDGLCVFVGLSDQQVKVHGQRVELMEIEHYLNTSFPSMLSRAVFAYPRSAAHGCAAARSSVCEWPCRNRAVGQFHLLDFPQVDPTLKSKLPSYMASSLLLVVMGCH